MASTHPDFVQLDASSISDAEMLKYIQDNIVPATRSLNGEFLELDSKRGFEDGAAGRNLDGTVSLGDADFEGHEKVTLGEFV